MGRRGGEEEGRGCEVDRNTRGGGGRQDVCDEDDDGVGVDERGGRELDTEMGARGGGRVFNCVIKMGGAGSTEDAVSSASARVCMVLPSAVGNDGRFSAKALVSCAALVASSVFLHSLHLQCSEHITLAWKHSQYFLRQPLFLQ